MSVENKQNKHKEQTKENNYNFDSPQTKNHDFNTIIDDNNSINKADDIFFLILINPKSGTGKSSEIFKKNLLPKLNEHNIEHEVFISQKNFRVSDYLQSLSTESLKRLLQLLLYPAMACFMS